MASKTNGKFNLTELLNQRSKEQAQQQKQSPATEPVSVPADGISATEDIYNLIPSQGNFYNVEDVSDLKQSIELLGVLQPLLVTEEAEDGKRRIIAGHRRRLAIMQLVDEGKERFRYVPILVKPTKNAILDKLALIMANRFREKTDWEKMTEALETEELVLKLKESMNIPGRTRDLLAEIIETSPAQVGRYKAIYNNLSEELMAEFKANKIGISVIYEASGLPEEYQKQAAELYRENDILTLPDVKQLKKSWEASKPIPGQMNFEQLAAEKEKEQQEDNELPFGKEEAQQEYVDPQLETITSICYSCTKYEECHDKTATVTKCNAYQNRREAYKTEEERYNEEQDAIDRETRKKLREMQQEEKMQHLPSGEAEEQKDHDIRISQKMYTEIADGALTFLILKKDNYGAGEEVELKEYKSGTATGRAIQAVITYVLDESGVLDDKYCIVSIKPTFIDL